MSLLNGDISEYQETMANETNIEQMFITLQPFMLWITPSEQKEKNPKIETHYCHCKRINLHQSKHLSQIKGTCLKRKYERQKAVLLAALLKIWKCSYV